MTIFSQIQNIEERLLSDLQIKADVHVVKLITVGYEHILSVDEESLMLRFDHYNPDKLLDG